MPARLRAALSIAGWTAALAACARSSGIVAEEAILAHQIASLERLVSRAEAGALIPSGDLVIAVDEEWTRSMLALELPREQLLANGYRVRVDSCEVRFRDGLGLIRLNGRVSPPSDTSEQVFAELSVYGSLDVIELDPASGVLHGRVEPLAFEVRSATLVVANPLGRQLLEELGREHIDAFRALGSDVTIPVRLDQTIELPGMGPEGPVEFEGAQLPLRLAVSAVTAIDGRLWISVRSRLSEEPSGEPAPEPGAPAGTP